MGTVPASIDIATHETHMSHIEDAIGKTQYHLEQAIAGGYNSLQSQITKNNDNINTTIQEAVVEFEKKSNITNQKISDPVTSTEGKYQNYLTYALVFNEDGQTRADGTIVNVQDILETFNSVKNNWNTTHSSIIISGGNAQTSPNWKSLLIGSILSIASENKGYGYAASKKEYMFYIAGFVDLYHAWLHVLYGPILDRGYNNLWLSDATTSFLQSSFILPANGLESYWNGIPKPTFPANWINTHNFFGVGINSNGTRQEGTEAPLVQNWFDRNPKLSWAGNNNQNKSDTTGISEVPYSSVNIPNPYWNEQRLPYLPVNLNAFPHMIIISTLNNNNKTYETLWTNLINNMSAFFVPEGNWSTVAPVSVKKDILIYDATMIECPAWTENNAVIIFMTLNGKKSEAGAKKVYNEWYGSLTAEEKELMLWSTLKDNITTHIEYIFE